GLGLGLAIVRKLAHLHNGTVAVRSEGPGCGSEFILSFPVLQGSSHIPEQAVASPSAITASESTEHVQVLLIDDNRDICETLSELMTEWGHTVEVGYDGKSGVELILKTRPDVALIDIGLPGMDGYEVAGSVKRRAEGARPRLIAMTGYGQES